VIATPPRFIDWLRLLIFGVPDESTYLRARLNQAHATQDRLIRERDEARAECKQLRAALAARSAA
jgi:hypothetical protein